MGPGPGAGVDILDAGPADFDAGPGVLDAGPPAGGRDDFLFSPGFAMEGDGAEVAVAVAAEKIPEFNKFNLIKAKLISFSAPCHIGHIG